MMYVLIISPLTKAFCSHPYLTHELRVSGELLLKINALLYVLYRKNRLVEFTVTDFCDKVQIGNSNLCCVREPEITMQAKHQSCRRMVLNDT